MSNVRLSLGVAALLLVGSTPALPLVRAGVIPSAPQLPATPTQTSTLDVAPKDAKTVQVTMTTWRNRESSSGSATTLQAVRRTLIRVDREMNRAKYEHFALPQNAPSGVSAFDGKTVTEYLTARNQYRKTEGGSLTDGLGGAMYHIALGLSLGWKSSVPEGFRPAPDERLNGKTLKVYERSYRAEYQGVEQGFQQKFYVDAETRLPTRYSLFITDAKGKTTEVNRVTFADWKLDEPIDPAQINWTPPTGATEYTAPTSPQP